MSSSVDLQPPEQQAGRPRSAVSGWTGVLGVLGLLAALYVISGTGLGSVTKTLICLAATALPMLAWDILIERVHLNPSTGLDYSRPGPMAETLARLPVKVLGLWATWAVIALGYWTIKTYSAPSYAWYLLLAKTMLPVLLPLSILYIVLVDRYAVDPKDGYWHAGLLALGRWAEVDREALKEHAMAWAIKAFFLAFMCSILPGNIVRLTSRPLWEEGLTTLSIVNWSVTLLFTIDIAIATVGYVLTFKVTDSHVRSSNPLMSGWVFALICYPPFVLMNAGGPLAYATKQDWIFWLEGHPTLFAVWGALLVLLVAIYALATVNFGLRFSNLTHRGILTHGAYAWTKHPAYLSKNLYWWMVYLPFLSTSGLSAAVQNSLILLLVNLVYYARAKTEEAHLLSDPVYRAYAAWIAEHGLLARLRRLIVPRR